MTNGHLIKLYVVYHKNDHWSTIFLFFFEVFFVFYVEGTHSFIPHYRARVGYHLLAFALEHSALSCFMFLRPTNTFSCKHDGACRACATKKDEA